MRALTLTALAVAIAGSALMPAHAGDFYTPPPPYVDARPTYGYAPPPFYRRAPGVIAAPEGPAYVVPGPAYQAGDEYESGPVLVDGRRYYRECWWNWGFRQCAIKSKYWAW